MDTRVTAWSPSIEVGIAEIDSQHRELFQLAASFREHGDEVRVMKALAMLCDYAKVHLRDEELMLEKIAYPDLEAHLAAHAHFRTRLRDLLQHARSLTLDDIADRVEHLINHWFYQHIVLVDMQYVPLVKAHLASQAAKRQPPK